MGKLRALIACIWRVTMHKVHVYRAGRALGLGRVRLLKHDLSKYSKHEIFGYAGKFHGGPPEWAALFKDAWRHHWQNNRHHWEYWASNMVDGGMGAANMPYDDALEMAADWFGASRQYAGSWPTHRETWAWYCGPRQKIRLSETTNSVVEEALDRLFAWSDP